MGPKFLIGVASFLVIGGSIAFAQTAEQASARFVTACVASMQLDDPLGSERRHQAYCRCRLDTLTQAHSSDQINQISAYIEEGNGGVVPRATPLVGSDLAANESAAVACRRALEAQ
jgi:hypothetical protein